MRNLLAGLLIAWALALYPHYIYALDLNAVYQLARQNDPQIRQVREQFKATQESKPQAQALLRPYISLSANGQFTDIQIPKRYAAFKSQDQYLQKSLSIDLSYPLYHKNYWIQLDQADDIISKGQASLNEAESNLIIRTAQAYFNVLSAADDLRAATAEKQANAKQLSQSQSRFEVGTIAITSVHEAKAAYDIAVAQEIAAANSLNDSWEALQEIIGHINQPILQLGDKLTLHPPRPKNIEQWISTALRNNHSIQAAQKSVEIARKSIDKEHSGYYPTLDIVSSYGIADSGSTLGSNRATGVIGLQLKVPLYQGGAVVSKERQAVYEYRAAQEALDQQRRAVNRQVHNAFRGILSTISRVKALESAVVSSQTALQSAQAGLEVGTRTMVDVLSLTKTLYQAQRDYDKSRYDYILSGLTLHQAAGTLTLEVLNQANSWLSTTNTQSPPESFSTYTIGQ
ncbi:hypothetical protein TI05_06865 [Achromatium sp. WMS3]|nr:hypothetical protein TI05_06865 [Achromatium sp. WMS3]